MRQFDQKFGAQFLAGVPLLPGIYRFFDRDGELIYVGKAIRLRRRLQQYRNSTRLRRHKKMRKILKEAARLEFEVCASHREACLLELDLIQRLRPRLNVSGAYSFLYPMVGVSYDVGSSRLVLSLAGRAPEQSASAGSASCVRWHGCYRSRAWTREFFFSLVELLEFSAHREPTRSVMSAPQGRERSVVRIGFRQVDRDWVEGLERLLRGEEAEEFLSRWILQLVDNAGARARSAWVQDQIKIMTAFYRRECLSLRRAREQSDFQQYPVARELRDRIFLEARLRLQ
jgi:hypothetical protein